MAKSIRVGLGFDIHRLKRNKKLFLGGVQINFSLGLEAHSDGDVVLHAICDSILGAIGKQDIGYFFPNNDPRYKGICSLTLLEQTAKIMRSSGYGIVNLDCVVICDAPKISPYVNKMKEKISNTLKINKQAIAIKATTTEGILSFSKKGIAAYCAALLKENKKDQGGNNELSY